MSCCVMRRCRAREGWRVHNIVHGSGSVLRVRGSPCRAVQGGAAAETALLQPAVGQGAAPPAQVLGGGRHETGSIAQSEAVALYNMCVCIYVCTCP